MTDEEEFGQAAIEACTIATGSKGALKLIWQMLLRKLKGDSGMRIETNSNVEKFMNAEKAAKHSNGTLFKLYDRDHKLLGVAIAADQSSTIFLEKEDNGRRLVHLNQQHGSCGVFDDSNYFVYQLMNESESLTISQN